AQANLPIAGGILGGTGTINGNVNNTGGTLSPGQSIGAITINGNYTGGEGSAFTVELGGTGPGQFDTVHVTGNATINGTLNASLVNGLAPARGDSFLVMSVDGTTTGNFTTENL